MRLPYYTVRKRGGGFYFKPGEEAQEIFERYHEAIPGVNKVLGKAESRAKRRGYVKTMMGRHINFPGKTATHKAGGLIFQGTAADALKLKMCELCEYHESEAPDGRLMLVVHDEFDSSLPPGDDKVRADIKRIVEEFDGPMRFRVPIRSDAGEGPNWAEASL
jgi:DNA polymerase-1